MTLSLPLLRPVLVARPREDAAPVCRTSVPTDRDRAHDPEREWVRQAQGGDEEAFRRLVDRYSGASYEVALRIIRSAPEAEEATQDAFLRVWKALPAFREEARFSTWLYRIVTRRALDVASRRKTREERETATPPKVLADAVSEDPGSSLPPGDLRRLDRVLGRLDPLPRAVVTLFYLRDRPVAEVAKILDLPANTVKTHLHRARATLREAWHRDRVKEERHGLPRL